VLSEHKLLRAMFDVGYFPPNTPRIKRADAATMTPIADTKANDRRSS
jgi:hypothetical protein